MPRDATNATRSGDARRRLDRAAVALTSGVAGYLRIEFVAQDGTLTAAIPIKCGEGWEAFLCGRDLDTLPELPASHWSVETTRHYWYAVLLLSQVIDRLTKVGTFACGWVELRGDGRRLLKPTAGVEEKLAAILVELPATVG